jgi:hypothetical protein
MMARSEKPDLTVRTFISPRHTTCYLEAGPVDRPLMIFLHGWPQIELMGARSSKPSRPKAGGALHRSKAILNRPIENSSR